VSGWTNAPCLALALLAVAAPASARQAAPVACAGLAQCRAQTEAAIAEGAYERAHDLAWRTAQQGPRNDRASMFLLARTQALSGRPDDALVMLRRLAELGMAADVSGGEFQLTRELPGWPAVESLIAGIGRAPVAPPVAPTPAPKASSAPVAPAVPVAAVVEDVGHFASRDFAPGGLACDAVSRRFVFGDQPGRKLLIVAEGSDRSIDLTRAESAGFLDVMALDIDTTNGNLWVASAAADGQAAMLHKLQLISGRSLASYGVPDGMGPVRPVDVTVTASGAVLLLDVAQGRVLVLRAGAPALVVLAAVRVDAPVSLAVGSHDGVAYLAHRDGLSAIDLRTRAVAPLAGPKGIALGGIERLRRNGAALIGVQVMPDGSRRLVRLSLDAAGRAVTRLRVIDSALPPGVVPTVAAVCGDTLAYLVSEAAGTADEPSTAWTIRRIRLNP
jgi:hypothetical protein